MEKTGISQAAIAQIQSLAAKHHLEKVILFGSRARGDYSRASDIDLAVCGGNVSRFSLDVDEETATPLKYNVINLDGTVRGPLLTAIQKEGVLLYEKI